MNIRRNIINVVTGVGLSIVSAFGASAQGQEKTSFNDLQVKVTGKAAKEVVVPLMMTSEADSRVRIPVPEGTDFPLEQDGEKRTAQLMDMGEMIRVGINGPVLDVALGRPFREEGDTILVEISVSNKPEVKTVGSWAPATQMTAPRGARIFAGMLMDMANRISGLQAKPCLAQDLQGKPVMTYSMGMNGEKLTCGLK